MGAKIYSPTSPQYLVKKKYGTCRTTPTSWKNEKGGLAEVEAAKKDGRWKAVYDSPSNANIPEDFLKALKRNKRAEAFFQSLNKTNLYSIAYRLQTAKTPKTREKRMAIILEMMAKGEKFR